MTTSDFSHEDKNMALNLSLEFGENWRQGIVARIIEKIPAMSVGEATALETCVFRTRDDAIQLIVNSISQGITDESIRTLIGKEYPWLNDDTLERLLRQGHYYAWRS